MKSIMCTELQHTQVLLRYVININTFIHFMPKYTVCDSFWMASDWFPIVICQAHKTQLVECPIHHARSSLDLVGIFLKVLSAMNLTPKRKVHNLQVITSIIDVVPIGCVCALRVNHPQDHANCTLLLLSFTMDTTVGGIYLWTNNM